LRFFILFLIRPGTVEISSSSHQTEASGEFTDFSRPQSKAHFGTETWDLST